MPVRTEINALSGNHHCLPLSTQQALDYLSELDKGSDPAALEYIERRWVSVDYVQRYILRNFFRFG